MKKQTVRSLSFHTIKSILNKKQNGFLYLGKPGFHTIKSILNDETYNIYETENLVFILLSLF